MEKKKRVGRIEKWGKRRYGFLGFSFSFLLYGFGRDSRELKVEKYKMNIRLVTLKKNNNNKKIPKLWVIFTLHLKVWNLVITTIVLTRGSKINLNSFVHLNPPT